MPVIDGLYVYDPSQLVAKNMEVARQQMQQDLDRALENRQRQIDYAQSFIANIGELKGQTSKLHQGAINSEIDALQADVRKNIVKKNKKGRVTGLNIYDPDFQTAVRDRVARIGMMNARSQAINDKMEVYARAEKENKYNKSYSEFSEDLIAAATSDKLLAVDTDIDAAFSEIVDKYDNSEMRIKNFVDTKGGEKTAGINRVTQDGREYEVKLEMPQNYYQTDGTLRVDALPSMMQSISSLPDGNRTKIALMKEAERRMALDPMANAQKDPIAFAAQIALEYADKPVTKSFKEIDPLDAELKRERLRGMRDTRNRRAAKEQEDVSIDNMITLVQQPFGPSGFGTESGKESTKREAHERAVALIKRDKSVNDAGAFRGNELADLMIKNIERLEERGKLSDIDFSSAETPEDKREIIKQVYGIDENQEYFYVNYTTGNKDDDIVPLANEESYEDIGAIIEELRISPDLIKGLPSVPSQSPTGVVNPGGKRAY